jgi:hypothetical protein
VTLNTSSIYGSVRQREQQISIQHFGALFAACDENESSTEFPNGGRNSFPNALKKSRENKAVSLKNSVC